MENHQSGNKLTTNDCTVVVEVKKSDLKKQTQ